MPPRERSTAGKSSPAGVKRGSATSPEAGVPEPVATAIQAVAEAPDQSGAWERLEAAAVQHECPGEVAEAYRRVLHESHPPALLASLGERAARFHQEWLADQPALLVDILERVLEVEPAADWARKRLIVLLTLSEKWPELLAVYGRLLDGTWRPPAASSAPRADTSVVPAR